MAHRIVRDFERPDPALYEGLRGLPATFFTGPEGLGNDILFDPAIKPLRPNSLVIGPAFTVWLPVADLLIANYAITLAAPGDVLVIACAQSDVGVWGGSMTISARNRGLAGVVLDGAAIDSFAHLPDDLPVFARTRTAAKGGWSEPGSINVPVRVGGRDVHPGDLIVGDINGVLAIARDDVARAAEVVGAYRAKTKKIDWLARLKHEPGATWFDILEMRPSLDALGIPEVARERS